MAQAVKAEQQATTAHPAAQVAFKKGVALFEAGDVAASATCFREAVRLDERHAPGWINLGTALRKLGKLEASAVCSQRALEIAPENAAYLTNYGNCLVDLDRLPEAVETHAKAARLKPGDYLIRRNYAIALREAGMFDEALPLFQALSKIKPDDIQMKWEEALTYLYLGRYAEGWKAFEIRWQLPNMRERSSTKAKRWRGEDLSGKTILIYDEQGFGDSILCSRYIPLIQKMGAEIMVECKPQLHRLLSSIPGITKIGDVGHILSGYDYHVPMMSLPGIFGTDLSSIPPPAPLYTAPAPPPEAAKLLALGEGRLKVGVVWSGSVTFANNRKRAVGPERFLPFAEVPGVQLYSLQKGPREPDLAAIGADHVIPELGPHVNDFSETAAVLKQLDLVIMTDSSVAHLAGSLGVPVWNMLSYRPYWLYLSDRADCPWYPTMRLFRQTAPGDWDSVFARVTEALRQKVAKNITSPSIPLPYNQD